MEDNWKELFTFNRRQRNGILVLLTLITGLLLFRILYNTTPETTLKLSSALTEKPPEKQPVQGINMADSLTIADQTGINRHLARTIVRYRTKLGGYYSMEQLHEVYGMDSMAFSKVTGHFKIDTSFLRKIDINTCNEKELGGHPYLNYTLAEGIINYRKIHGEYEKISDLRKVLVINDSVLVRIKPYLYLSLQKNGDGRVN